MNVRSFPALCRAALWFAATACCATAAAQSIQPGLWELKTRMAHSDPATQKAMAQAQQQLAAMPPAQRKQMEAILGQQGLALDGQGGMRVQSCVTAEMANRFDVPTQEKGCKNTQLNRSGDTMTLGFECQDPHLVGKSTVRFISPKHYTVQTETTQTERGQTKQVQIEAEGRWIGAACTAQAAPARAKR